MKKWRLAAWLALLWATQLQAKPQMLEIPLAQQHILSFSKSVTRVAVGDPAIADVEMIDQREVLITSKKLGSTSLKVWLRKKAVKEYLIKITPSDEMRSALDDTGVQMTSAGNDLILNGDARSLPEHAAALAATGSSAENQKPPLDQSRMSFRHQVQTDIKIVEISHNKLKSAGFFLSKNNAIGLSAMSPPGVLSSVNGGTGGFALSSESGFLPGFESFNFAVGRAQNGVLGVLSVLEGNGFAYTLAEPSLVTLSGQDASFIVGGEFPFPIRQGSGEQASTSIEFKEFGIRLYLTPTVLSEQHIMLRVAPEVSELDFSAGVTSGGVSVPSLRLRRTETSIELGDGESFVISGLVSRETVANVDKVPWLGDIPILGAFFRSSRLEVNDRELIMVVTPHLVSPLAANARLPALPGEGYRNYEPGSAGFIFLENGDFDAADKPYGFSD